MSDTTDKKLDAILSRLDHIAAKMDSRFDALEKVLGDHMAATTDNFATVIQTLEALRKREGDGGNAPRYATG